MLQRVADALQCDAVCCSVMQCVAVRCSALQCVAVSHLRVAGSARSEKEQIGDETQHMARYLCVSKRTREPLCVVQDRIYNTKSLLNAYAGVYIS